MNGHVFPGGRYVISKQTLAIRDMGEKRELLMLPAETVVFVESLSADGALVKVSYTGILCTLFTQDLVERGSLAGMRITSDIFATCLSPFRH